jgi:hypothetical protein
MLVTKRFEIVICGMVEENLEHKRVYVPFCIYVILLLHLEGGSFNFQEFPSI